MIRLRFTLTFRHPSNSNNDVVRQIKDIPLNWEKIDRTWKRGKEHEGIMYEYSSGFEFVGDGYEFIKTYYDQYNITAKIEILVEQMDQQLNWQQIYSGILNMHNISFDSIEGNKQYLTVNAEQDDFDRKILSRMKTKFSLTADRSADGDIIATGFGQVADLRIPGTIIRKKHVQESTDNSTLPSVGIQTAHLGGVAAKCYGSAFTFGSKITALEVETVNSQGSPDFWHDNTANGSDAPWNRGYYVLDAEFAGTYTFQGYVNFGINIVSNIIGGAFVYLSFYETKIQVRDQNNVLKFSKILASDTFNNGLGEVSLRYTKAITFDETITLDARDKVYIFLETHNNTNASLGQLTVSGEQYPPEEGSANFANLTILADTTYPSTICRVIRVYDALKHLTRCMTGTSHFESDHLGFSLSNIFQKVPTNREGYLTVTNGFQIRQFPYSGSDARPIETSFDDMIDSLKKLLNVRFGFFTENGTRKLRVEPLEYFYPDRQIFTRRLKPRTIKRKIDSSKFYSKIEIGYNNWQNDSTEVVGLDEVNSIRQYATWINQDDRDLVLTLNDHGSTYEIEEKRRDPYVTSDTKDINKDEGIFYIDSQLAQSLDVDLNAAVPADDNHLTVENVIDDDTLLNTFHRPTRMLRRWFNVFQSMIYNHVDNQIIRFVKGEGNYRARFLGGIIGGNENANYQINKNSQNASYSPIWIPELLEFDEVLTHNEIEALESDPNGYIEVEDTDGTVYTGWIEKLTLSIKDRKAKFTLLRRYDL